MYTDYATEESPAPDALKTLRSSRPSPEYTRGLGVAADLRAGFPIAQLIRKWRLTESQIELLREEMALGRYGGSTGRP